MEFMLITHVIIFMCYWKTKSHFMNCCTHIDGPLLQHLHLHCNYGKPWITICLSLFFDKTLREFCHTSICCITVMHVIVMHFIYEYARTQNKHIDCCMKEFYWLNDFCPWTFSTMVKSKHKLLHSKVMVWVAIYLIVVQTHTQRYKSFGS